MSVQQIILKHPILHIRPEASPQADNIDAALTASGILADTCTDVYRATARICSAPKGLLRVLIVSLDDFCNQEMEFFALIRRTQPSLTVYVHASSASSELVQESVALGASGLVTHDTVAEAVGAVADAVGTIAGTVDTLAEPCRSDAQTPAPCGAPPSTDAGRDIHGPTDHPLPEQAMPKEASAEHGFTKPTTEQPVTPPDISFDEDDEDDNRMRLQPDRPVPAECSAPAEPPVRTELPVQAEPSAQAEFPVGAQRHAETEHSVPAKRPVQVPWLRRPNPPLRVAPTSGDAPDSGAPPRRPPAAGAYAHEPLLSEDELRALMDEEPCDGSNDHPAEDDPHHTGGMEDER